MIRVLDKLMVGSSTDERGVVVDVIVNVAKDLKPTRGWPEAAYYHIGLVDGPGNDISLYLSAVFALNSVLNSGRSILVSCHEGKSRSMSVAIMYIHLVSGRGWNDIVDTICERNECAIPEPHKAHREAFDSIDWDLARKLVGLYR